MTMRCLLCLLIWWFAVIDAQGIISYFEYVRKRDCKTYEQLYKRVPTLKVSDCQQKEPA